MKQLFIIFICLFLCFSCQNINDSNDKESNVSVDMIDNGAKVMIKEDTFNFGKIMQGESVEHEFVIKNSGNGSLIILNVKAACGCTVPEWPEEEILPGEEAIIHVTFNSQYKSGRQNKTVTLITNATPSIHVFTIIGEIVEV